MRRKSRPCCSGGLEWMMREGEMEDGGWKKLIGEELGCGAMAMDIFLFVKDLLVVEEAPNETLVSDFSTHK